MTSCPPEQVGINASHPGGRAYVQSVIDLWVEWGVDAIEADDFMGGTADPDAHTHDCCAYLLHRMMNHARILQSVCV